MQSVGFIGGARGRLGNMVGYQRGGKTCFRVYQPVVRNPKTNNQMAARTHFSMITRLASLFRPAISQGFLASKEANQSVNNAFVKANYKAITGGIENAAVDFSSIKISQGSIPQLMYGTLSFGTPGSVRVSISDTSMSEAVIQQYGATHIGIIMMAAYLEEREQMITSETKVENLASLPENVSLAFPDGVQGQQVKVWSFIRLVPKTVFDLNTSFPGICAPSTYLGSGEVA